MRRTASVHRRASDTRYCTSLRSFSEKGVRLAQKMQVGPCIPVGIQLEKAEVGPTFSLSNLGVRQIGVWPDQREGFVARCAQWQSLLFVFHKHRGLNYAVPRLGMDVKVIRTPPCICCMENH
jgi:hypothetical protein